ncbi:MAG: coproporphyrinogen III oxidase family protein [Candidatus Riflebacteria bacterium]|nr:coproporphyrinogen III oxidase family protein [Candidatus Riflebacteria bacterium]
MSVAPLGLYVHVPFCLKKCDYCAFASAIPSPETISKYIDGISRELTRRLSSDLARRITTVFIGGGNPTAIGPRPFASLVHFLTKCLRGASIAEWTIETNPETLTPEFLPILRDLPKLRLSIGAQRLDDDQLIRLGRLGTQARLEKALDLAFSLTKRVGIDLILGIPGCPSVSEDLAKLLERFQLEHISAYFLTAEPETPLGEAVASGKFPDPADVGPEELFELAAVLRSRDFEHYEISNFARQGGRCRHNMGYWDGNDYLGFGPAAVETLDGRRCTNPATLIDWLGDVPREIEPLSPSIQAREYLMLHLRLISDGLNLRSYERRFGLPSSTLLAALQEQTSLGFIEHSGDVFRLARSGIIIANRVIASLFDD